MTDAAWVISRGPDRVGESPIWDERLRALWWVDIESRCVRRWMQSSGALQSWQLPGRVGCSALAEDGRMIAAMESRIVAARLHEDGRVALQPQARDLPEPRFSRFPTMAARD